uniref:Transposase n=1 Tax=Peronospora matthiolae TaxID=2874970 RepID=A0AAV1T6A3_9STRA
MGKPTPFEYAHALRFGVKIKSKEAKGSATCWCLFCVHDGRDEVEVGQNGRKCKRNGITKVFTAPFYLFKCRSHFESQHSNSWALYRRCQTPKKALFFASKIKLSNKLHHLIELKDDALTYDISACIYKTIVSDLFFRNTRYLPIPT